MDLRRLNSPAQLFEGALVEVKPVGWISAHTSKASHRRKHQCPRRRRTLRGAFAFFYDPGFTSRIRKAPALRAGFAARGRDHEGTKSHNTGQGQAGGEESGEIPRKKMLTDYGD